MQEKTRQPVSIAQIMTPITVQSAISGLSLNAKMMFIVASALADHPGQYLLKQFINHI